MSGFLVFFGWTVISIDPQMQVKDWGRSFLPDRADPIVYVCDPNSFMKILCLSGMFPCIPKLMAGRFSPLNEQLSPKVQEGQPGSSVE